MASPPVHGARSTMTTQLCLLFLLAQPADDVRFRKLDQGVVEVVARLPASADLPQGRVHPDLGDLLMVVNGTGRRIRAILALRGEDLRLKRTTSAPHGAIQWPGETDKEGKAWAAPINTAAPTGLHLAQAVLAVQASTQHG